MFSTEFLDVPSLQAACGTVTLPGSKSISNRVLLMAALCDGVTTIHDLLDSDDTRVMLKALEQLGCGLRHDGRVLHVTGIGGRLQPLWEHWAAQSRKTVVRSKFQDSLARCRSSKRNFFWAMPAPPCAR